MVAGIRNTSKGIKPLIYLQMKNLEMQKHKFMNSPGKLCQLFGVREVDARDAARGQLLPRHVLGIIRGGVLPNNLLLHHRLMVYVFIVI